MPDIDTSKLEAVNTMLSLIGEMPVNSLETNPTADVTLAVRTLDEQNRQLQLRGWNWNTDYRVTIKAEPDMRYKWQTDWIRFDVEDNSVVYGQTSYRYGKEMNIERRGGFLWNAAQNTDVFDRDELEGNLVRYLEWEDLPERARNFLMIRAARIFLNRTMGDAERAGYAISDEQHAWHALLEAETDQADYNILHTGAWPFMRRHR